MAGNSKPPFQRNKQFPEPHTSVKPKHHLWLLPSPMQHPKHNQRQAISGRTTRSNTPNTVLLPADPSTVTSSASPAAPTVSPIQRPTGQQTQTLTRQSTHSNNQSRFIAALLRTQQPNHSPANLPIPPVSLATNPFQPPTTPLQSIQPVPHQQLPNSIEPGQALHRHIAGLRLIQQQLWVQQQQLQYHATEISNIQLQLQQQYHNSYTNQHNHPPPTTNRFTYPTTAQTSHPQSK